MTQTFFLAGNHPLQKRGLIGGIRLSDEHRPSSLSNGISVTTYRFPQPT